jgi:3-hydroxybutyryl-CoA dehydrogenase
VLAKECFFIIEAVYEDLNVKKDVFQKLDENADPNIILASNTSSLSITDISESCKNKSRVLAVHFLHPAHLIPLVEITPTPNTDPAVVERSKDLLKKIGKSPVLLKKVGWE